MDMSSSEAQAEAMLQLRTLGGVRVISYDGQIRISRARELALLLYVACDGSRPHSRSRLAEMFWPRSDARHALHCVSQAMYRLSREIPGLHFSAGEKGISVPGGVLEVDVLTFGDLLRHGEHARARDLYGGPFLDGFVLDGAPEFSDWSDGVRREVALLAEDMFRVLMDQAENAGEWRAAEDAARALLLLNPYDEGAVALEAALLARRGERARARKRIEEAAVAFEAIGQAPGRRFHDVASALNDATENTQEETTRLPLIGRSGEFERLKAGLAAAQVGRGGAVAILGKAGIGKTRVLEQLIRLATLRGFRVLTCAGTPVLQSAAYAGTRQILSTLDGNDVAQLPSTRREALAHVLPPEAGLPGRQVSEPLPRDWLYSGAAALLEILATSRPIVIALEDMQWIDPATLDLVRFLSRALTEAKVLLVGTARADELNASASDLLPGCTSIQLSELSGEAAGELVEAFRARARGALPDDGVEAVRRLAGGHPLFLLELLKGLRTEGASAGATERAAPDSITDFIAMRLKRLSHTGRATADALAVLGKGADRNDIAAVAHITDAELADAVDELMLRGLVRDGAAGLEFLHDLMREGTRDSMSVTRRRMLHKRALRALQASARSDPFTLVFHAEHSGDGAATHRYATAAAQLSERRYGAAEAEPYWRLALHSPPNPQARLLAQERLAGCLYSERRNDEAATLYARILLSGQVGPAARVLCEARLLALRARNGGLVDANEFVRVSESAEALEDPGQRLKPFTALTAAMLLAGRTDLLNVFAPRFGRAAMCCAPSWARANALGVLAEASLLLGRINEAIGYVELARASSVNLPTDHRATLAGIRALAFYLEGDLRRADLMFSAAIEEAGSVRRAASSAVANWALVKLEQGEFTQSCDMLNRVISIVGEAASTQRAVLRMNLAELHYEQGNLGKAAEEASRAVDECAGNTVPAAAPLGLYGLAIMERDEGEAARARTRLSALIDQPAPGHDYSYAAVFLARMAIAEGKPEEANSIIERFADYYSTRDFFCHARIQLEQARLLGLRDRDAGLALAREVRARASDAGAVLLLNRAEALIRQLRHGDRTEGAAGPVRSRGARGGKRV